MANNLGSMILELGANSARFESDMGKAARIAQLNAEKMQKTVQGAIDGISSSLGKIAGGLAAAFSVDRLVEFTKSAIDAADEVGKMAQKVGLSTEALSAYQVQAKLSNVANDQLQGGLSKLAKAAAEAAGGSKQQAAAFDAIGVSVKDAEGKLRPMGDLVQDVSKKFASYEDSAAKTALAQQFFGKSGAELIPFLNELGQKSLPEVTKQAEKFGAVISGDTAKAAEHFNDNLTSLGIEAQGFATAVAGKLLPSLNALTDQMMDAGKTTDGYSSSADGVATAIKGMALALLTAKEVVAGFTSATLGVLDAVGTVFNASGDIVRAWAETTGKAVKSALTFDKAGLDAADAEFAARFKKIATDTSTALKGAFAGGAGGITDAVNNVKKDYDALFGSVQNVGKAAEDTGKKLKAAPIVPNSGATDEASKALQRFNELLRADEERIVAIQGRIDPVTKAYSEWAQQVLAGVSAYEKERAALDKAKGTTEQYAAAKANVTRTVEAADAALKTHLATIQREQDVVGQVAEHYAEEAKTLGLDNQALEEATAIREGARIALENYNKGLRETPDLTQKEIDAIKGLADSFYQQKTAADLASQSAKEWQGIWKTAGDNVASTFAKVLVEGGSLFNGLKDLAKQTVEAIIAYFARLSVINPILNAIFGGSVGFSLLPQLGNAAVSSGGASILGANGSAGSASLFSPSSWVSAGQSLFQGFQSFWGGGFTNPASANFVGPPVEGQTFGASYGGLGQALGVAGGIYAGYNRYKQGGLGGGLAGGAAYGLGTYALGAGLTSAVAGTGFAAGVSGSFAIPVVGWVALAAMLIDKFSGGKLFGTGANKFQGGTQTETISATGVDVSAEGTFKGQKAFFGGSYYKTKSLPVSSDAQQAADDFYAALKKGTDDFAKSFGLEAGEVVGGAFKTTFDAKGNVTGTESTVLGVTRKGETEQQFAERLQADSFAAVLDKMGLNASAFVAGMQDDADKLFAAVQDFAQVVTAANTDLGNGFHFLALSTHATLVDVVKFTEAQQKAGETLTQTYARLEQAQAQYDQFVGQFKPGTQYVDDFEAAYSQLYHQMLANIDAANQMAIAAGASGAASQDLANIQQQTAQQMAALVAQLEQSAQSLAFSLGVTDIGSLQQTNDAIQAIIDSVKNAPDTSATAEATTHSVNVVTGALGGLGNAAQQAAQKISDSINLLLGSLSPLNDQQKLQVALQGLRAGTVTQEQVLQIGRNLYASSQAYNDLFSYVQQFPGGSSSGGKGGKTNGRYYTKTVTDQAVAAAESMAPKDFTGTADQWKQTGLTTAQWNALSEKDKQKLEDLLTKQATLNATKQAQDFQTLGQQIAEIATAKGESFQQVIDEMGINNKDLEKGLGLKSDEELNAYLKNLQDMQDSAQENTKSIVDAINLLPREIADAINGGNGNGGKPGSRTAASPRVAQPAPAPSPSPAPAPTPAQPPDGSTAPPRGRVLSDGDVKAISLAVTRPFTDYVNAVARSGSRVATVR